MKKSYLIIVASIVSAFLIMVFYKKLSPKEELIENDEDELLEDEEDLFEDEEYDENDFLEDLLGRRN